MIKFTREEVARWSAFSGDNNPLHYPPLPAQCIVQGMYCFLYLLARVIKARHINVATFSVETLFRKYVYTNTPYFLTMSGKNKLVIRCCDNHDIITAKLNTARFPTSQIIESIKVDRQTVAKYRAHFRHLLPESTSEWIFYCALCFSLFLTSEHFLRHKNKTYQNVDEYFRQHTVTQLSQSVITHQRVTDEDIVEVFITGRHDIDLTPYRVVRTFVYGLRINNKTVMHMRSVLLTEGITTHEE